MDIVLINPGDKKLTYQNLGNKAAAIEPPYWIAVLASYLEKRNISVSIIDANAKNLSPKEVAIIIADIDPYLSATIVYGSQPSASTQNMTIACKICNEIKKRATTYVAIGGLHPTALPEKTLKEENVDFIIEGEGFFTLEKLIKEIKENRDEYENVPGLWWWDNIKTIKHTNVPGLIPMNEFPTAAWDLLPMERYRAHNWHCFDDIENRSPYAAIYTSLGCPYSCSFCCVNVPFGGPGIRFRKPKEVINEIDVLVNNYGIKNLKIIDELFVLKNSHYMTIIDYIIEGKYNLNMWVYARIDTINEKNLDKMKKAGVNWLALGIESANQNVVDGISKRTKVVNVKHIVKIIQDAGIRVIGNYIFGLPDDTIDTMEETLQLAIDLNCEFANFYSAMAYPGSKLYNTAIENKWKLPDVWHGYSQHSHETLPLPTKYISAKEVLQFRDNAFNTYFSNPNYLNMVEEKFGTKVKEHIIEVSKDKLKRKLLKEVDKQLKK